MMNKKRGPLALIVIDGWGYSAAREGNAIALAATPFYDELCEKYPSTLLEAHGSRVGLPAGVMGNSEVGHLNIGAGRVIRMDVSLVDHEIVTGEFFRNSVVTTAVESARHPERALHLMGLCSDGQVHSSLTHLYALLKIAKDRGLIACLFTASSTAVIPHPLPQLITFRRFSESWKRLVAARSQRSSAAITQWIVTSVGRERSALTTC